MRCPDLAQLLLISTLMKLKLIGRLGLVVFASACAVDVNPGVTDENRAAVSPEADPVGPQPAWLADVEGALAQHIDGLEAQGYQPLHYADSTGAVLGRNACIGFYTTLGVAGAETASTGCWMYATYGAGAGIAAAIPTAGTSLVESVGAALVVAVCGVIDIAGIDFLAGLIAGRAYAQWACPAGVGTDVSSLVVPSNAVVVNVGSSDRVLQATTSADPPSEAAAVNAALAYMEDHGASLPPDHHWLSVTRSWVRMMSDFVPFEVASWPVYEQCQGYVDRFGGFCFPIVTVQSWHQPGRRFPR